MMFTEPMIRMFAIVSEKDAENVTETLLSLGVMEFITTGSFDSSEDSAFQPESPASSEKLQQLRDMRKRVENLLATADIIPDIPNTVSPAVLEPVSMPKEHLFLDDINGTLRNYRERQRTLQNDILKYEEMHRQVALYGSSITPDMIHAHYSYVTVQIGSVPFAKSDAFRDAVETSPAVVIPVGETEGREHLILITMKRNQEQVTQLLKQHDWIPVEFSSDLQSAKSDISTVIDKKLQTLHTEQTALQQRSKEAVTDKREKLCDLWTRLRVDELRIEIRKTFRHTARTLLFSGWLPVTRRNDIQQAVISTTNGRCHMEWFTPDETSDLHEPVSAAPVKLNNPRLLAPFQMLVTNFGIPEYGTIDPTPFVVITYLTMFGIMFADIGQGAIIALTGIIGTVTIRKNDSMRRLASLLIWCGAASVLTGFLFGSFFGFSVTRPLWFDFHGIVTGHAHPTSGVSSIFDILGITIKFGITVISCGLVFNWINLVIKKRWIRLFLDKTGIPGGWIYGGGIHCAWFMIRHDYRSAPPSLVLFFSVALPALLLFFKAPLHAKQNGEPFTLSAFFNFVMEWIVELLEVFSGYLSNTLSFMRVAGLGIAHVSLMVAFFTLADLARGTSPTAVSSFFALLLLIAGNIMVILLEGLSAGIQALRLNYYEFFTKFFTGTGKLFQPVSLRNQSHL